MLQYRLCTVEALYITKCFCLLPSPLCRRESVCSDFYFFFLDLLLFAIYGKGSAICFFFFFFLLDTEVNKMCFYLKQK